VVACGSRRAGRQNAWPTFPARDFDAGLTLGLAAGLLAGQAGLQRRHQIHHVGGRRLGHLGGRVALGFPLAQRLQRRLVAVDELAGVEGPLRCSMIRSAMEIMAASGLASLMASKVSSA
jgi:hypothetical protein